MPPSGHQFLPVVHPLQPRSRKRKSDILATRKEGTKLIAATLSLIPARRVRGKRGLDPEESKIVTVAAAPNVDAPTGEARVDTTDHAATTHGAIASSSVDTIPMKNPRISGPTSETPPRCELVAFVSYEGKEKRIHVFSSTTRAWGPTLHGDIIEIRDTIVSKSLTAT